jgi:hypothetical protein
MAGSFRKKEHPMLATKLGAFFDSASPATKQRTACLLVLLGVLVAATGCTSATILAPHFQTTLVHPDLYPADRQTASGQGKSGVIYRVSEGQAFIADRLAELQQLRDKGLVTEEEYQAKRRQILDGL